MVSVGAMLHHRRTMSVHLKLLLACLFWGATPTIGRVLAEFKAPFVVVCGRFMVACVFLVAFCAAAGQFRAVPRRHWWRFAALGATGILLHNGLLYKGLEYTSATNASIVVSLTACSRSVTTLIFGARGGVRSGRYRTMPFSV